MNSVLDTSKISHALGKVYKFLQDMNSVLHTSKMLSHTISQRAPPNTSLGTLRKLPPELRVKIYDYVNEDSFNMTPQIPDHHLTDHKARYKGSIHDPNFAITRPTNFYSLRLTSKQINAEATKEFFSTATFIIQSIPKRNFECQWERFLDLLFAFQRFESNVGISNRASIKRLEVIFHPDDFLSCTLFQHLKSIMTLELRGLEYLSITPFTQLCTNWVRDESCSLLYPKEQYYKSRREFVENLNDLIVSSPNMKKLSFRRFGNGKGSGEGSSFEKWRVGLGFAQTRQLSKVPPEMGFGLWDGLNLWPEMILGWENRGVAIEFVDE